jgi:hypothetical protein
LKHLLLNWKPRRTLNPLQARYFFENCNIQPKSDVYSVSIQKKSASVETFRRHGFAEEF